jgi:hypothetical protein
MAFALGLTLWRPLNPFIIVVTAVLMALFLPPMFARVFQRDMGVPFISQFNLHPLIRQLVVASIVPCVLVLIGMIPTMLGLLRFVPAFSFSLIPIVWIISLFGHVESVGKKGMPAARGLFTVIMGSVAIGIMLWNSATVGNDLFSASVSGLTIAVVISLVLLFVAEIRRNGMNAAQYQQPPPAKVKGT